MEEYYCLLEIDEARKTILELQKQIPELRQACDNSNDRAITVKAFRDQVQSLWSIIGETARLLTECGEDDLADKTRRLLAAVKHFSYKSSNYTPLSNALIAYAALLPKQDHINAQILGHLANRVKMGFYPTDPAHVDLLKQSIVYPQNPVNFLDPCCGTGQALEQLAAGEQVTTYGVEIDDRRAESAANRLTHVGVGSYFQARISRQSFHLLFLNPPYLSTISQNGNRRSEKLFLADSIRHLMMGGILVYIIPHYRVDNDISQFLLGNLEHLQIYKFLGSEFKRFGQVALIGYRRPWRKAPRKAIEALCEMAMQPNELPNLHALEPKSLILPNFISDVSMFRGASFNVFELEHQLSKSNFHQMFAATTLDKTSKHPLLPLNLSQIGLVGASGQMDGLVNCDYPHVIKGRIQKITRTRVESEDDLETEIKETTTNKMIFNVLTPFGVRSLG